MPNDLPTPALPEGFDLEKLLSPIAGDAPQGIDPVSYTHLTLPTN